MTNAVFLFDQTLSAFFHGGQATGTAGELFNVHPLVSQEAKQILTQTSGIWKPLKIRLKQFLSNESIAVVETEKLIRILSNQNLLLLKLINDLTNQLEAQAKAWAFFMRAFQALVVILVLLSFMMATFRLYRRENYINHLVAAKTVGQAS